MKKLFLLLSALVLGMGLQAQIVASKSFIRKETSKAAKSKFSGYVEQMNILIHFNSGDTYSTGGNLSFGYEWNNRWYVGGGISYYWVKYNPDDCDYTHSSTSMDFFSDIKFKILNNFKVTPVFGLKLGVGVGDDDGHIIARPSAGVLFRLGGRHELMLNWEYVPSVVDDYRRFAYDRYLWRHGLSLNLGYKF